MSDAPCEYCRKRGGAHALGCYQFGREFAARRSVSSGKVVRSKQAKRKGGA